METKIMVDPVDEHLLAAHTWRLLKTRGHNCVYWVTTIDRKLVRLHRLIMRPTRRQVVDHLNGNTLDNRRLNLRVCEPKHNCRNRKLTDRRNNLPKNIHFSDERFIVKFKDKGNVLVQRYFDHLADAVIFRDQWMRENNWNLNFGAWYEAMK